MGNFVQEGYYQVSVPSQWISVVFVSVVMAADPSPEQVVGDIDRGREDRVPVTETERDTENEAMS